MKYKLNKGDLVRFLEGNNYGIVVELDEEDLNWTRIFWFHKNMKLWHHDSRNILIKVENDIRTQKR